MIDLILWSALILLGGYLYRTYLAPKKPEAPKPDEQYEQFKSETGLEKPEAPKAYEQSREVSQEQKKVDALEGMVWQAAGGMLVDGCLGMLMRLVVQVLIPVGTVVLVIYLFLHSGA